MGRKGMSQESLKILACVCMLLDHIGAVFIPAMELRLVGRLAFPIYCFLLTEGVHHTRNSAKYGLRLAAAALLSEIPFDLLFFGNLTLAQSSVMVTLLLGFSCVRLQQRTQNPGYRIVITLPFMVLADLLGADYGGWGVAMVSVFALTRGQPHEHLLQIVGIGILSWMIGGLTVTIGSIAVPIQIFAAAALIPIYFYSGKKVTNSAWIQWGFYLFYPVHLAILLALYTV